jgi:hypothetical protein
MATAPRARSGPVGSGQMRGSVRQEAQAAHAPAGWVCPRVWRDQLQALILLPPGPWQPT